MQNVDGPSLENKICQNLGSRVVANKMNKSTVVSLFNVILYRIK